jgi:DCN1-like protein 3
MTGLIYIFVALQNSYRLPGFAYSAMLRHTHLISLQVTRVFSLFWPMGKCLSCCDDVDEPTENGQAINPATSKISVVQSSMSDCAQILNPSTIPSSQQQSTQSTKMFTSHPYIPPTKKPCDGNRNSCDISEARLLALYEKYSDAEEAAILAEGIERLCNDLEVKPDDFRVLVLAWTFNAETMCQFTSSEFMGGCRKLNVDSIAGIQSCFSDIVAQVQEPAAFKEFYRWTYKFGLDVDKGQRTLPTDMAISLWRLVFHLCPPPILEPWLEFLVHHSHIRGISKDTWDMFLNFSEVVGNDLSTYDETEAWPSLFDDFVEYENDRQNQNLKTKDTI